MIRAILVEDEPLAAQYLRALLLGTGEVEVVGTARDGQSGLRLCAEWRPRPPFSTCIFPARTVSRSRPIWRCCLSLLSSYLPPGHARARLRSLPGGGGRITCSSLWNRRKFKVPSIACKRRLNSPARKRVRRRREPKSGSLGPGGDRLPVKNGRDDVIRLLPCTEIVAALRHDRRTWIHTAQEEHATYYPLNALLRWLPDPPFLQRCSRNHRQSAGHRRGDPLRRPSVSGTPARSPADLRRSLAVRRSTTLRSPQASLLRF